MRNFFLFFLLNFSFAVVGFSQKVVVNVFMDNKVASAKSDSIYYHFNQPLKWSDFQGVPAVNHPGGAVTASGFAFTSQMNYEDDDLEINIGIYTFFTKSKSWKKEKAISDYHLLHEQKHFDITRIGANKLMKELKKASFNKNNYQALMSSIFNRAFYDSEALQNKYDRETKNSMDEKKQEEWNQWVSAELLKLEK